MINDSQKYRAELFSPSEENWTTIKERIVELENQAFPTHPYSEEDLHRDFINSENSVVLLRNIENQQIIGYVYSVMVDSWYPERFAERNETVFLDNIVLDEAYRGMHLAAIMTNLFESELKKKGFKFFEVNANIPNGYAGKIERAYKDRIVVGPVRQPFEEDAQFGQRNGYKIRL